MKKSLISIPIVIAYGLAIGLYNADWPALQFIKLEVATFFSYLGSLLLFALLIERAIEVFLAIRRSEESYKLQAEVQRLISGDVAATDPKLKKAQEDLIEYKIQTERWALPTAFFLGLLIASFGVRVLGQIIVMPAAGTPGYPSENQLWYFRAADIILNGCAACRWRRSYSLRDSQRDSEAVMNRRDDEVLFKRCRSLRRDYACAYNVSVDS